MAIKPISQSFLDGYLECALWSSTDNSRDDGGDPLDDNYGVDDISEEGLQAAIKDCNDFIESNQADLDEVTDTFHADDSQHGHDFWLTRNGHGAGFWDRGYGDLGETLSKACKPYGSVDLYVGDDGKIHGF